MAKPGEKIKVPVFIRRKGADIFHPALAAGGSLMAYKGLLLCDFFIVQQFFKLCHIAVLKLVGGDGAHLGKYQNFSANFVQPAEINKPY